MLGGHNFLFVVVTMVTFPALLDAVTVPVTLSQSGLISPIVTLKE